MREKICKNCRHCKPFYDSKTVCFLKEKELRYFAVRETDTCEFYKSKRLFPPTK